MAAAAANWGAYLIHLGFSEAVKDQITVVQGYDSPDRFAGASTKSEIEDMVSNVALYAKFLKMTGISHTQARGSRGNVLKITGFYEGIDHKKSYRYIPDYREPYDNKNSSGMLEDIDDWLSEPTLNW